MNKQNTPLPTLVIDQEFYAEAKSAFNQKFLVVSTSALLEPDATSEECSRWFATACSSGKVLLVTRPTAGRDSLLKSHAHRAGYGGLIVSADIKKLSDLETITNPESDKTNWRIVSDPRQLVEGWPEIKPDMAETPLEPFPLESLPLPAQRFCRAVAESVGVDVGYPGVFCLSVMAAAIGASHQLQVKPGRRELPVLWLGILGRPGTGKSPSMGAAFAPLRKIQKELFDGYKRQMTQFKDDVARWKKNGDFDMPQKPARQSVVCSNATVESLIMEMANSPRGTIFAADELAFWFQSLNAYKSGGGSDREWWLSSWSSIPLDYTRRNMNGESILVNKPCLSVCGGIQPDKIDILAGKDDGLLSRFLLASPQETRGKYSRDGLCFESQKCWDDFIQNLWKLEPESSAFGEFTPRTITLSAEAHDSFALFADGVTAELNENSMPEILRGSWSKADTHVARLALIIHVGKVVSGEEANFKEVSNATMGQAISLVQYFLAHLLRLVPSFDAGVTRQEKLRHRILAHIKRHRLQIQKDGGKLEWRTLRHALSRSLTSSSGHIDDRLLEQTLQGLAVTGHLRILDRVNDTGKPLKPVISVNPILLLT